MQFVFGIIGFLLGAVIVYLWQKSRVDNIQQRLDQARTALEQAESQLQEVGRSQDKLPEIEKSYQSRIQELEQSHQNKIKTIEDSHQVKIQELESTYQTQIQDLQARQATPPPESSNFAIAQEERAPESPSGFGAGAAVVGATAAAAGAAAMFGAFSSDTAEESTIEPVAEEPEVASSDNFTAETSEPEAQTFAELIPEPDAEFSPFNDPATTAEELAPESLEAPSEEAEWGEMFASETQPEAEAASFDSFAPEPPMEAPSEEAEWGENGLPA
ncbi:hypothetical protein HC931_17040 [Candidatus Gracilibacteria bacterium]|nr:hypothetical protein [Candidatus Gracilibacteria bacterium]